MKMSVERLKAIAAKRKMELQDLIEVDGSAKDLLLSDEEAVRIADKLCIPASHLGLTTPQRTDLHVGAKISRWRDAYQRTADRSGVPYYTYRHLAKTTDDPSFMPLHITLLCGADGAVQMNPGHEEKEFVYVLRGRVRVDLEKDGISRTDVMEEGDSIYLEAGVAHSFVRITAKAEILAVNYR